MGDLPENAEEARSLSLRRGVLYRQITELPQVVIAAIDGLALGGGCVLAAACDFRIATHRARLGLPEVSLGWPPNYGMGILQSLIGRGRLLELALSGQGIRARRAEEIGLVNRVVSPIQLEAEATNLARAFETMSAAAIASTKRLLAVDRRWSDEAAAEAFVDCLTSETARNSIGRFRE